MTTDNELQMMSDAFAQGFMAAKKMYDTEKSCSNCKHQHRTGGKFPCSECYYFQDHHADYWEPKP